MNKILASSLILLATLNRARAALPVKSPSLHATMVILAQVDPNSAIDTFKTLLAKFLLLIGVCVICYGGYLIARGHQLEGLMCIIAGFLIAISVALVSWLALIGGINF